VNESKRRVLLVDCDQFFVQCARIADPAGAGRAELLLVGGSATGRGVVTSASYPTRVFGVRSGMPMAHALRLCPDAMVVAVPRELCSRKSRDVRAVLERFTPVVEPASIDESYLDLAGTTAIHGHSLEETARRVRVAVEADAGIVVSIGGATNRMVAKLAAEVAKPAGVHVVPPGEEAAFMRRLGVADIPGVGPVMAEKLRRMGIVRVDDGLGVDEDTLAGLLGRARGAWLFRRLRGVDDSVVESRAEAKSMSRDETFPEDLSSDDDLHRELLALTVRLGGDLRGAGRRARTVTVRLRDADFTNRSASRTLQEPLESDRALFAVARELLAGLRAKRRVPARLIGVAASHFSAGDGGPQLALFEEGEAASPLETGRDRELSRAVDALRARFGRGAVVPGRLVE